MIWFCPEGVYSWIQMMRQIKVKPRMGLLLDSVSNRGSGNTGRNLRDWKKHWKKPRLERTDFDPWLHRVSHLPHSLAFAEVTGPPTKGSKTEQPTFPRDWTVKWSHNLKYQGTGGNLDSPGTGGFRNLSLHPGENDAKWPVVNQNSKEEKRNV